MRVGYMAGDAAVVRKCTMGKQSADLHTANLTQAIVDKFLRKGLLPDHIRKINADYNVQLEAMLEELDKFPAGTKYTRPEGGLFIWVELPEGIDTKALLDIAVKRGVAYVPGTHFYADGGHENTFRLNFSNSTVETIHRGMKILRGVIEEALA